MCDKIGEPAKECIPRGYIQLGVDRKRYYGHRLAWFYVHGEWPGSQVDHINGIKTDNRIENLRVVSAMINKQNNKGPRLNNKSGFPGVTRWKNPELVTPKWRAQISFNGVPTYLGTFDSPELAYAAYLGAKRLVHPGNTL